MNLVLEVRESLCPPFCLLGFWLIFDNTLISQKCNIFTGCCLTTILWFKLNSIARPKRSLNFITQESIWFSFHKARLKARFIVFITGFFHLWKIESPGSECFSEAAYTCARLDTWQLILCRRGEMWVFIFTLEGLEVNRTTVFTCSPSSCAGQCSVVMYNILMG